MSKQQFELNLTRGIFDLAAQFSRIILLGHTYFRLNLGLSSANICCPILRNNSSYFDTQIQKER